MQILYLWTIDLQSSLIWLYLFLSLVELAVNWQPEAQYFSSLDFCEEYESEVPNQSFQFSPRGVALVLLICDMSSFVLYVNQ